MQLHTVLRYSFFIISFLKSNIFSLRVSTPTSSMKIRVHTRLQ